MIAFRRSPRFRRWRAAFSYRTEQSDGTGTVTITAAKPIRWPLGDSDWDQLADAARQWCQAEIAKRGKGPLQGFLALAFTPLRDEGE